MSSNSSIIRTTSLSYSSCYYIYHPFLLLIIIVIIITFLQQSCIQSITLQPLLHSYSLYISSTLSSFNTTPTTRRRRRRIHNKSTLLWNQDSKNEEEEDYYSIIIPLSSSSSLHNSIQYSNNNNNNNNHQQHQHPYPFQTYNHYKLLPKDILYHKQTKYLLQTLREYNQDQLEEISDLQQQQQQQDSPTTTTTNSSSNVNPATTTIIEVMNSIQLLHKEQICNQDGITMTLVGYKGKGFIQNQINQDCSFVYSPLLGKDNDNRENVMQLMGVMDGHGHLGEVVSEYCVSTIPMLLQNEIENMNKRHQHKKQPSYSTLQEQNDIEDSNDDDNELINKEEQRNAIKQMLHHIFLSVNATIPTNGHGGCTASILFRYNRQIYIANVGDSKTFVFAYYTKKQKGTKVIYESREDKPHLQEEKERIQRCGGVVYEPSQRDIDLGMDTSRVIVENQFSLAMSRSLGDWAFSKYGVISKPIVDIIDLDDVDETMINPIIDSNVDNVDSDKSDDNDNDYHLFAVSATDGLLDYVKPNLLGEILSKALYEYENQILNMVNRNDLGSQAKSKPKVLYHISSAVEELILRAAQGWYDDYGLEYRDDITIAVMKVI